MPPKVPTRDPAAAHGRKVRAARRVGTGARCSLCREARPQALTSRSSPLICAECQREQQGKNTSDKHHVAGKANSPITIPVPVNDHCAELSPAQQDWPKGTLENREGSPLLAAAARIRGFADTITYLMNKLLLPSAEMLEDLDRFLKERLSPLWWRGTPVGQFAPERKSRVKF